ncbi:SDR family NAD(P)-dependent oxidoreductase [Aestuariicella hydrocarbonica]|uniref:SDR family NAD(P)-dependent oxidoreductase n=1 Tax=Pseudomaricurvus hydrocarbonicus TaxID=1470433 RepID=A0A9E5JQ10_9GAMM|nr:SDR family NAD(P)-dependent oxidoreductase [Aestuariicella hydrocarbonica]NHO64497.1 SDR family NAD(P)-dependent oxidoreductase [Aestuariicella hydrocarbonica]
MALPHGEIIWITGASSGIGLELAKKLAALGNQVLVTARNAQVLEALAAESDQIIAVPADLAQPDCIDSLQHQLRQHVSYLDRIILNAGTCEYLDINAPDWLMMERVMEVNFYGAVRSLAAALPLLESNADAARHVVAVGSQASRVIFPRAEAYGASKAALTYFMEALAVDLAAQNIKVTVVQPGFVETPLTSKNDFPMPFLVPVNEAVDHIVKRLASKPAFIRFPLAMNWVLGVGSLLPGLWRRWVAPQLTRST